MSRLLEHRYGGQRSESGYLLEQSFGPQGKKNEGGSISMKGITMVLKDAKEIRADLVRIMQKIDKMTNRCPSCGTLEGERHVVGCDFLKKGD